VSRFTTRTAAALLVLGTLAAYPVAYRVAERRKRLAPFQGEWLLLVGRAGADSVVPDPFDRRLRVTGDRIGDTRSVLPTPGHLAIGAVDDCFLVLTLSLDDGRPYGPGRVPYRFDGDTLHVEGGASSGGITPGTSASTAAACTSAVSRDPRRLRLGIDPEPHFARRPPPWTWATA
jgi:hypothetical protein